MVIPDFENLLSLLHSGDCSQICIVDNNLIEKLVGVQEKIESKHIFQRYDLILVPEWVYNEICDGDGRKRYLEGIFKSDYIKSYVIEEKDYSRLCGYKELELYFIVLNCCKEIGQLHSYIRKYVLDPRNIEQEADEMELYEKWIIDMYNSEEAFNQVRLSNGRIKRKNAGEISIAILSAILALYMEKITGITIFSYDQDMYKILNRYKDEILKEERFIKYSQKFITFKSNNALLHEWFLEGIVNNDNVMSIINLMRSSQNVKFTRRLNDGSIEEQKTVISNNEFVKLLTEDIHIIY
jgi:hypothetical protein